MAQQRATLAFADGNLDYLCELQIHWRCQLLARNAGDTGAPGDRRLQKCEPEPVSFISQFKHPFQMENFKRDLVFFNEASASPRSRFFHWKYGDTYTTLICLMLCDSARCARNGTFLCSACSVLWTVSFRWHQNTPGRLHAWPSDGFRQRRLVSQDCSECADRVFIVSTRKLSLNRCVENMFNAPWTVAPCIEPRMQIAWVTKNIALFAFSVLRKKQHGCFFFISSLLQAWFCVHSTKERILLSFPCSSSCLHFYS